jgi:predicted secreted protein
MSFFSGFAVYFIIWWVTLFAVLPLGVRTQAEAGDVTLGTTESAPFAAQLGKKALITTLVSGVIFTVYYVITSVYGLSVDSIPRIVPEFG